MKNGEGMNLREARQVLGSLDTDPDAARVFGEVYETADGAMVIPVTSVRGASRLGVSDGRSAVRARPAGVFVIKDGKAAWVPAVDAGRIAVMGILVVVGSGGVGGRAAGRSAMMGILVGLVSAALAGVAMVRRPPWPDLHGDISRSH